MRMKLFESIQIFTLDGGGGILRFVAPAPDEVFTHY